MHPSERRASKDRRTQAEPGGTRRFTLTVRSFQNWTERRSRVRRRRRSCCIYITEFRRNDQEIKKRRRQRCPRETETQRQTLKMCVE